MPRVLRYSIVVLVVVVVVILWGALVRATGSGAGCGAHWPSCNGEVVPRPESVELVIELIHRVTSGISFLMVAALLLAVLRATPAAHGARPAATAAMAFMIGEALLGAGLGLFELVAGDASMLRAWSMAAHLLNTYLLLAALALTSWHLSGGGRLHWRRSSPERRWIVLALSGMMVVGATGAITALGDTLFPAHSLTQAIHQDVSPAAHVLIRLRVAHPLVAVVVTMFVLSLPGLIGRISHSRAARRWGAAVGFAALAQLGVGALNVSLFAPVWLQLVHLLVADLVWLSIVVYGATLLSEVSGPPLDKAGSKRTPAAPQSTKNGLDQAVPPSR